MTQSSGFQPLSSFGSEYNSQRFVIKALMAKMRTSTLCKVIAVTNDGNLAPVGFVDLQPLVNQVSGAGVQQAEGIVYHVPYFRLQGGANAIIIDPQIGDEGMACFADSDISSVITNKAQSNPGSARKFDISDAMFFPCFLGPEPTQYMQFNAAGIKLYSPTLINLTAPDIQLNASTIEINGSSSVTITTPTFTVNATNIGLNGVTAIDGNTSVAGSMQNNGVDIGSGHAHQVIGVQTGGSTIETSAPNV